MWLLDLWAVKCKDERMNAKTDDTEERPSR